MKKLLGERVGTPKNYRDGRGVQIFRLKVLFELGSTVWLDKLEETILAINPDIIYVHGITTFPAIRCTLIKIKHKKFALVFQNYQIAAGSFSSFRFLYPIFKFIFSPMIIKNSNKFIAIAEEAKDFANKKIGIPCDKISVVPHGADPSIFYMDTKVRAEYRAKYDIDKHDVVFVYTGKILPYKGVHHLVNVGINLIRRYDHIKILIVGGGQMIIFIL